jgi:hypothetical protein
MANLKCLCYRLMLALGDMQISIALEHETPQRRGFQNTTRSGTRPRMGDDGYVSKFGSKPSPYKSHIAGENDNITHYSGHPEDS